MAENAPELKATLTLDDAASAVLDKLKGGFKSLSDKADAAKNVLVDIGKTAIGTAIGVNLSGGISALGDLGKSAVQRALDLQMAEKNATLMAMSVAKAGTTFDQLQAHASGFVKELKAIELQTGITGQTLTESFAQIADKMNPARATITATGQSILLPLNHIEKGLQRSEAQINQLFRDIGNAGRLVAGGPDALAKSFAGFSATSAKASDPIVQMIAASGVLKGNAQQVAAQLRLLTDASALSFAQAAIEKMAKKGREVAPDFTSTVNQLTALRDQFYTQFGQPILKTVVPVMERFRAIVEANRDKIQEFSRVMGEKVGKYVTDAGKKLEEGFKYLLNHSKEIGDAIERGAKTAEKVFKFILDHKEAIAIAFGVKAIAPMAGAGLSAGMGVGRAIAGATLGQTKDLAMMGGAELLAGAKASAAAAGSMLAFVAALAALTAAVYQASQAAKENYHKGRFGKDAELAKDQDARQEYFKNLGHSIGEQDKGQFDSIKKRYMETAKALGESEQKAAEYADSQWKVYEVYNDMAKKADEAKGFLEGGKGTALRLATDVPTQMDALSNAYVEQIVVMYNQAVKSNNVAAAQYAANIIAGSGNVQNALINAKTQLEGGFDGLTNILGDKGTELAQKLKGLIEDASGKGATPTKPVVQFNNNTFNLKQDFRDQDPDRIALIFRQDIVKQAESRRQARVGGAFGL